MMGIGSETQLATRRHQSQPTRQSSPSPEAGTNQRVGSGLGGRFFKKNKKTFVFPLKTPLTALGNTRRPSQPPCLHLRANVVVGFVRRLFALHRSPGVRSRKVRWTVNSMRCCSGTHLTRATHVISSQVWQCEFSGSLHVLNEVARVLARQILARLFA